MSEAGGRILKETPFEKIVVMGGSAGAVEPMQSIFATLPINFSCPILAVVHVGEVSEMHIALGARSLLKAEKAKDGERIQPGRIYVAPSGRHLSLKGYKIALLSEDRGKRWRPSVDCLFEAAAKAFGSNVVAVILSGSLDDGTEGAQALHEVGAHVITQHPDEAHFPSMPMNAIRRDHPSGILRTNQIANELVRLTDPKKS